MKEKPLNEEDIIMQDIICNAVAKNPNADNMDIYNQIYQNFEINSINTVKKIFALIKSNKNIFVIQ